MRALHCHLFGPIDDLVFEEVETPEPGPGEVRVRVAAVGLNFPDVLIVQAAYQLKPALPFAPGGEMPGVIDAIGTDVNGLALGDRVLVLTGYGAMAQ